MARINRILCFTSLIFFLGTGRASATGIQVTYNAAGSQTPSGAICANCYVTFDGLGNGIQNYSATFGSTGITGTYTGIDVVSADQYGGAGGTGKYAAVGAQSGTTSYLLSLSQPVSYFGLWFSAADSQNSLGFFLGGKKIAEFSTGNLSGLSGNCGSPASNTYCGNPNSLNRSKDAGEMFAYANFFGQDGTVFDHISFSNSGTGTGFESDNHAVAQVIYTPEPSTFLLVLGPGFLLARRWRKKS